MSNFCPNTRGLTKVVTYLSSLVQLCCGEGVALQTNITGVCGECSQCLGHTGFAPAHNVCAFPVYTAQAPGCSVGKLSKAGFGLCALPRSKLLRFRFSGTPQRHRLWWACNLSPSQIRAAPATRCWWVHSPRWSVHLNHLPRLPATWFPGCIAKALSPVCCVSPLGSWSLTVTILVDVNHPKSHEDVVSNWQPAHSLVEDAISRTEIAPCLLSLALARLPLCLQQEMSQSTAG